MIVVETDDQGPRTMDALPSVRRLIGGRGATLTRSYASFPLCCPSRASFLTGQLAHNHGSTGNSRASGGGYRALTEPGRTLSSWLDAAGYDTAFVGKWLNGLRSPRKAQPGWDLWAGLVGAGGESLSSYYDYEVFEARAGEKGGEVRRFGTATSDYQTDALTHEYALPLIAERARDRDPLFLWLSYHPPHKGVGRDDAASRRCSVGDPASKPPEFAIPAPRHADRFADARIPRVPSVNEADVSDKPERIRARRRLDRDELALLDRGYGCSLASLAAVDDAIGEVVAALRDAGELERTVLAFTSDQGILAGEHRYETKNVPYEEALRVPLFIRGPGIEPGRKLADPTMNADLAPTILDLAGVRMAPELRRPVDGISLAPLLRGEERLRDRAIPIEGRYDPQEGEDGVTVESYVGVRTSRYTYVERHLAPVDSKEAGRETPIGAGEVIATELYDNHRDPYQLESRHDDAAYAATRKELAGLVEHLRGCAGRACFVRAGAPPPDGD